MTPGPVPQPFLHELTSCVQAPSVVLSGPDGQIRPGGVQGYFQQDRRVLSELVVDVDGYLPVPVGQYQPDAQLARFAAVVRHLGDPGADPTVRLERERWLDADGMTEQLVVVNAARTDIVATVQLLAAVDFAALSTVKHGAPTPAVSPEQTGPATVRWRHGGTEATLQVTGEPTCSVTTGHVRLAWQVRVPPHGRWRAQLSVTAGTAPSEQGRVFASATAGPGWDPVTVTGPYDLTRLVARSIADLRALTLADPYAPGDAFVAAGSPWFLTLFGRDSLWSARLTLPLGTELARGTLHALARRQGTRDDPATAEQPGKIPHEIRGEPGGIGGLPPVYFGTVDATALWICLLHDAWRWGMPAAQVRELLPALTAALSWLLGATDTNHGFLAYLDPTGQGLANQGWKDSGDAIQFPDGTIAAPPIALCEAQAYAYEAAISGAALLAAFDRPGAARARAWAAQLAERFREAFWVRDARGRFPAIALEAAKRPVPTAASNLGHLLGTGLLTPAESSEVATRLAAPDLDCGYGLRTMSADVAGFNPLGYHAGTVWPHDTGIAVRGLTLAGHPGIAATFIAGLLRAAPAFEHRFPELFAGTDGYAGAPVLAYPASCRPQAWSAAATVTLLRAMLGLSVDVPNQTITVRPPPDLSRWFPLRVEGFRLAGHPLTVSVDAAGRPTVTTSAPVTIRA